MTKLRENTLITAALGHFSVDFFAGLLPVLMAQLSVSFELSNKEVGFAVVAYTFTSSLSQPLFGYLGDRLGGRLVASAGMGWIAVWMAVAGFAPNYYILVASLLLAGLGSGAFHPQGAVYAARNAKKGSGISIFFVGGRLGFTAAPLLGSIAFATTGPSAMVFASIFGLLVALGIWYAFPSHGTTKNQGSATMSGSSFHLLAQVPMLAFLGLILSQGLRSGVNDSYTTYIPKLYLDQGLSPAQYGLIASMFVAGSSVGGLIGGFLADRWNKKWIISGSMILAVPIMYAFIHAESDWRLILALLTGTILSVPFTPIMVIAQELMPHYPSFISGVTLSFLFACGALATSLVGVLADSYGLANILSLATGILAVAFVFSLLIPSAMGALRHPQPASPAVLAVESDPQP